MGKKNNKFQLPVVIPLQRNLVTRRQFVYSKDGASLDFTLSTDKKIIAGFQECLTNAIIDVTEFLNEVKAKENASKSN